MCMFLPFAVSVLGDMWFVSNYVATQNRLMWNFIFGMCMGFAYSQFSEGYCRWVIKKFNL